MIEDLKMDPISVNQTKVEESKKCTNPNRVTNECLRELYQTSDYKLKATQLKNQIGITGYLGEAANFKDSQLFLKSQRFDQLGQIFSVVSVNGGKNSQNLTTSEIERQLGVEVKLTYLLST